MIFRENRLLADDSHVISYLIFVENWERCRKICRLLQLIGAFGVKSTVTEKIYDAHLHCWLSANNLLGPTK